MAKKDDYEAQTFPGASPEIDKLLASLLDLEEPIRKVVWEVPDIPRAAVNNILGAISQLKDGIKTERTLRRE